MLIGFKTEAVHFHLDTELLFCIVQPYPAGTDYKHNYPDHSTHS